MKAKEDVITINNAIKIIGIIGNSGSGKSTVAKILKSLGCYVIDADDIAHEIILHNKDVYIKIIQAFGTNILQTDSIQIDRKKLGQIVFSDKKKLDLLNSITHPYIIDAIVNQIKLLYFQKEKYKYIILDAPLLIETNLHEITDEIWLIDTDENLKIERLKQRDKISQEMIMKRWQNQISIDEAKKFADVIINNDGTPEQLETKIKNILKGK